MKMFCVLVAIMVISVLVTTADALIKKPDTISFIAISAKSISPAKVYVIKVGQYFDILIDHNVYAVVSGEFVDCLNKSIDNDIDTDGHILLNGYYHKYEIMPSEDEEYVNIFLYKFIDEVESISEDFIKVKKQDIILIAEYSK